MWWSEAVGLWAKADAVGNSLELSTVAAGARQRIDRGRDAGCPAPPAQIRTCPIRAYGSYLGCLTAKRWLGHG
jgi:hypothetical protein